MRYPMAPIADVLGGGLGIAAVLLVAGWILIRWQQDRHRFLLMRTALERGITRFADAPPYWLLSLRHAVTTLAIGVALGGVGAGAYWLGHGATMPAIVDQPAPPPPRAAAEGMGGPGRDYRRPPPPPNPEMEKWHLARTEQIVGLVSIGIGIILTIVGLVRIVFAQAERQHAQDPPLPT